MTGASPGKRNASRYCLSASSTLRSSKLNDLQQFNTIIICFYTYTWYLVNRSFQVQTIACNSLIKIKWRIMTMPKNQVNELYSIQRILEQSDDLLNKSFQDFVVGFLGNILSNHGFIQSGILLQECDHLPRIQGIRQQSLLLEEGDPFNRLGVELFCSCVVKLVEEKYGTMRVFLNIFFF